jgi:hypothetical protein
MNKKEHTQDNYVALGLKRLDDNLIGGVPPKIKWGENYKKWDDARKVKFLETLACSMNHAADLIQKERNEIVHLCELKDQQIEKIGAAMNQNMLMLQAEMTTMNEQRQRFNTEIARLNAKVRDLEKE